jgi:hypothetical protein
VVNQQKNISFSIISLVLIIFLALPTVIKLIHASDHLIVDCNSTIESHIHAKELDCDFNKFNLSNHFYVPLFKTQLLAAVLIRNEFSHNYIFTPETDTPLFSLRAPPSFS